MSTFQVEERSLADLQADMAAGRADAQQWVAACTERIEALDRRGPRLASVIEPNRDAPASAGALDAERRARGACGPLHGMPIPIEDNIDTFDRMQTSTGSLALALAVAGRRRRLHRAAPARRRCGDPGQDQAQ